jgi:thymidylate synthase
MMFGRSDLAPLTQFNSQMKQFSDDGLVLAGAYGPHIRGQAWRVLERLRQDADSRQAVIEIPRPQRYTKDEPCTLSFQFLYRNRKLHMIVTMRSNDVWLGLPYDFYTFSQILNCFAGALGRERGQLTIRAGSFHLYERDLPAATMTLATSEGRTTLFAPALPGFPPPWMEEVLVFRNASAVPRDAGAWQPYADVLLSSCSDDARSILRAWQ